MPLSYIAGPRSRYLPRRRLGPFPTPPNLTATRPQAVGAPRPNLPKPVQVPKPSPERRQLSASVFLGQPKPEGESSVVRLPSTADLTGRQPAFSLPRISVPRIQLPRINLESTQTILNRISDELERLFQSVQRSQPAPQPQPVTTGRSSVAIPSSLRPYFESASRATGVPIGLLAAMARVESGFRPNAVSPAGAIGLMQLMPATAKGLGVNPWDPAENVMGGARYIADQLRRFGDIRLALAAYNAGPGRVSRAIRQAGTADWSVVSRYLPQETRRYVPLVLRYYGG